MTKIISFTIYTYKSKISLTIFPCISDRMEIRIAIVLSACLRLTSTIEIMICDCDQSVKKGIFAPSEENCNSEELFKPENAMYEIRSYRDQKIEFTGHFCEVSNKISLTEKRLDATEASKRSQLPTRPKLGGCLKMAGIESSEVHLCLNKQIMTKSGNKWIYHQPAEPDAKYLQTTASFEKSCLYEPILLTKDCHECDIKSALGTITNVEQTQKQNGSIWNAASIAEGTVIWQEKDAVVPKFIPKILDEGEGLLYKMDNSTFRLTNAQKQLDFIITKTTPKEQDCNISLASNEYWAKEMTGIIITVYTPEDVLDPLVNENSSSSATTSTTLRPVTKPTTSPTLRRVSKGLADDIKETSHLTFIRNTAVDDENILAKAIKSLQCESQQSRFFRAISTAQWNGWLAAKQLGYPNCSRLIPVGATARLEVCNISFLEISAKETICGPQPLINENLTISVNGFETTRFSNCYHKGNIVNFNGEPYSYDNNDWKKIEQRMPFSNKGFVNKFVYTADNSLETFVNMDASNVNIADHVSTLADIMAIINEHQADSTVRRPHAISALIPVHEKENHSLLQSIATWFSYFGGISFAVLAGFIIFKFCGGHSALKMLFSSIGMPSWATSILSGNFLDLCNSKPSPKEIERNPNDPQTIIQINQNNLDDDDSLELEHPRRPRHKKQKDKSERKKKKRSRSFELV